MLIYVKNDETIYPNHDYKMGGDICENIVFNKAFSEIKIFWMK